MAACEDSSVCSRRPRAGGVVYRRWGRERGRGSVRTADSQTPLADCSQMTIQTPCASGLPKHKNRQYLRPTHSYICLFINKHKSQSFEMTLIVAETLFIRCKLKIIASTKLCPDPLNIHILTVKLHTF